MGGGRLVRQGETNLRCGEEGLRWRAGRKGEVVYSHRTTHHVVVDEKSGWCL